MQAGELPADVAVTRRIFVNGVHRHHVSDRMDAVAGSDLPDQVSGVNGVKARTGSVTFAPHQAVTTTAPSPLQRTGGWPPRRGDSLDVYDEIPGLVRWKRATATVKHVGAGLGEGEVDVEWTDDLEASLSAPSEQAPIAHGMPGEEVSVGGELRRYMARTGIEPWGIVVSALHDAGYRLLPSVPDLSLYALLQGNLHPRIGRIAAANKTGNVLEWDNESGFQYVSEWAEFVPGYEDRIPGRAFTVYLRKTRGGPDAQTRWTMADGAEMRVTLQNSSVALSRNGVVLAQQGFTSTSSLPWAGMAIRPESVVLWYEGGTRTVAYDVDWGVDGIDWKRVRVLGAAALASSYESRGGWPGFSWPSLRFRGAGPSLVRETTCTRGIEKTTVKNILADIGKATLTGFWLDEQGLLQWMPSTYLESQAPVETITTRSDVIAGSWSETGGGVASSVVTSYQHALITSKPVVGVTVGQSSSGRTFAAGETEEDFVGPEATEEWIEPDMTPLPAGQNTPLMTVEGKQSWWGGSYLFREGVDGNGNPDRDTDIYQWANLPFGDDYLRFSISEISPRRWAYSHTVLPGAKPVELVTLPNSSGLHVSWRDKPLPIWRARAKVTFADAMVSYQRGPAWAPSYEHDIGAWGSRADAQRVGDYLSTRMSDTQIMLNRLDVWHDPRRQLGDVVDVNAQGTLGGALRCLVVGIHESSSERGVDQSLDLRVIRVTPEVRKIYADIESTIAPYSGIESGTAPYSDLEA